MRTQPIATGRRACLVGLALATLAPGLAPADAASTDRAAASRYVEYAPWKALSIDEPATPELTVDQWTVAARSSRSNRRRAGTTPALVEALAAAGEAHEATGELQDVVLSADAPYEIIARLTVPPGVRLLGMDSDQSFPDQAIVASDAFPADLDMVMMEPGSALVDIEVDGRDVAWRIVRTSSGEDFTISRAHLHSTNSRVGPVGGPYNVVGSRPHTDIVLLDEGTGRVLIEDSVLSGAGVAPDDGGRGADPSTWSAFAAGIYAAGAHDVTIRGNLIDETGTAGITVVRAVRIRVSLNRIRNVSRNAEWWKKIGPVILGDGITGYNNGPGTDSQPNDERHWIIERNWIENSGNHGVHLSGMSIYVGSNLFRNIQGVDVFLGSTTNDEGRYDCVENVAVRDNVVIATQYKTAYERNGALSNFKDRRIEVRHYIDEAAGQAPLVDEQDFSGQLQPAPVLEAADPEKRDCHHRMEDR